jgi:hypothetical protein
VIQAAEAPPPPSPPPSPPPIGISPADIVTVRTASELQQAVQGGARDIEVVNHLDLRSLQLLKNPSRSPSSRPPADQKHFLAYSHTMYAGEKTRSIRVCCYGELLPCVVLFKFAPCYNSSSHDLSCTPNPAVSSLRKREYLQQHVSTAGLVWGG